MERYYSNYFPQHDHQTDYSPSMSSLSYPSHQQIDQAQAQIQHHLYSIVQPVLHKQRLCMQSIADVIPIPSLRSSLLVRRFRFHCQPVNPKLHLGLVVRHELLFLFLRAERCTRLLHIQHPSATSYFSAMISSFGRKRGLDL